MRHAFHAGAAVAACLALAPARAAEPVPQFGPVPAWVVPAQPAAPPKAGDAPLQYLYSNSQERITAAGVENYVEFSAVPLNTAGLQMLGNVIAPWNVERTDLKVHRATIRRGSETIDVLRPAELVVLRRENNLEKATLDGIRTVVLPVRGLQVGDVLSVAYTYTTKPFIVGKKPEELVPIVAPYGAARVDVRFLIEDGVSMRWKLSPGMPAARVTKAKGATEHLFTLTNVPPPTEDKLAPPRFKIPLIQASGYANWAQVADEISPLFATARKPAAGSTLIAEADRIAATSNDPVARMTAALRLAQEKVRYVALLLDEGAYVPATADETWERKFGDCKGKTALLLALLDRLGIAAEPMLVSGAFNDRIGEQLPSLYAFDHVLVRANVGGQVYILDATDFGQRTLEELRATRFLHGLPLRKGASLEALPQVAPSAPLREVRLEWDASRGITGAVPFEAVVTLRGPAAAFMRAKLAATMQMDEFDKAVKELVPTIANDAMTIAERQPEAPDGAFVVRLTGRTDMDWTELEGKNRRRFAFSQSTVSWKPQFEREKGPAKDWPVSLDWPYWERTVETVVLPDGGKDFTLEDATIDETVAGSAIRRTVTMAGNRATMVADFRFVKREISASEAREGMTVLEGINDDRAYVEGPVGKPTKSADN